MKEAIDYDCEKPFLMMNRKVPELTRRDLMAMSFVMGCGGNLIGEVPDYLASSAFADAMEQERRPGGADKYLDSLSKQSKCLSVFQRTFVTQDHVINSV